MSLIKTLIMGITLTVALASYVGGSDQAAGDRLPSTPQIMDSTAVSTVTITKVKKPWYAFRSVVIGKMEKTIPQYQAIEGLRQKLYSFTAKGNRFGGIYFWQQHQNAVTWFNPAWFSKTKELYGEEGVVEYYSVRSMVQYSGFPEQKGQYWSVLTRSVKVLDLPDNTRGIVQKLELTDTGGQAVWLTVWTDKKAADDFFKGRQLENEYFDTPLAIVNGKK